MIRAVFFDAAGTLFDSREPIGRIYARIAREHGLDAPEAAVAAQFRRAFGDAPGLAFGPGHSPAELRRMEREWWRARVAETFAPLGDFAGFDAYFDAPIRTISPIPAIGKPSLKPQPVLLRLKDRGIELGVISNFDHRLYRILEGLDLARHFDSITISSEAGYAKPRREIFESALARHRAAPDRGDARRRLRAARFRGGAGGRDGGGADRSQARAGRSRIRRRRRRARVVACQGAAALSII